MHYDDGFKLLSLQMLWHLVMLILGLELEVHFLMMSSVLVQSHPFLTAHVPALCIVTLDTKKMLE